MPLDVPPVPYDINQIPGPQDPAEAERWTHTRRRRSLLYSQHRTILQRAIEEHVGPTRARIWGAPDLSANPYLSLWEQVARMYAVPPEVVGMPATVAAASAAGLWQLQQRTQRDTLGLREMYVGVEVVGGAPVYTPMFPDMLECRASAADPSQPVFVRHTRWEPGIGWIRVTWSIEGEPYYTAEKVHTGPTRPEHDVSEEVLGGAFRGEAYPFRTADGEPIIPGAMYHAAECATLWDPYAGQEIVEGSLYLGVFYTYFGHVVRTCAWAQRYASGVDVDGAEARTSDGNTDAALEVIPDPATVLMLRTTEDAAGQPVIGQWAPPVAPDVLIGAIRSYEERLVEAAGLRTDVTRQSSDIRSGYSLAVARDAIREAQRVYEPIFARSDERLLQVTAHLLGQPVEPVRITYQGLPVSPQERRALIDEVERLQSARLISRVEAWQRLHPGASEAEARTALAVIDAEGRQEATA